RDRRVRARHHRLSIEPHERFATGTRALHRSHCAADTRRRRSGRSFLMYLRLLAQSTFAAAIAGAACSFPSVEYDTPAVAGASTTSSAASTGTGGGPCIISKQCNMKAAGCADDARQEQIKCAAQCLTDPQCYMMCSDDAKAAVAACETE